jgi:hypothetical protein
LTPAVGYSKKSADTCTTSARVATTKSFDLPFEGEGFFCFGEVSSPAIDEEAV